MGVGQKGCGYAAQGPGCQAKPCRHRSPCGLKLAPPRACSEMGGSLIHVLIQYLLVMKVSVAVWGCFGAHLGHCLTLSHRSPGIILNSPRV